MCVWVRRRAGGVAARTSSRRQKIYTSDVPRDRRVRVVLVLFQSLLDQLALAVRDRERLAVSDDAVPELRDQREPALHIQGQQGIELRRHEPRGSMRATALARRELRGIP